MTVQELEEITAAWKRLMPEWDEYVHRQPLWHGAHGTSNKTNPSIIRYDFPYPDDTMNRLAVHPYLVAFAERISGSKDLHVSLGHLIGKYAGKGEYDQVSCPAVFELC